MKAIYYPYFEPSKTWLRSFLLFYDEINTIIPDDVDYKPSEYVAEIIDYFPNSFNKISPTGHDLKFHEVDFNRLSKMFSQLSKNDNKVQVIIDKEDGSITIKNRTFLYDSKITKEIYSLLKEYNLIDENIFSEIIPTPPNSYFVNANASHLILSLIAGNISSRKGLISLTDYTDGFLYNSLNELAIESNNLGSRNLATSIIQLQVPALIAELDFMKYKELRNSYSDLRFQFNTIINELEKIYQLENIVDVKEFEERIADIVKDFSKEINNYQKTKFANNIKRWSPLTIGTLITIGLAFINPLFAIPAGAVTFYLEVQKEKLENKPKTNKSTTIQMLGDLKSEILPKQKLLDIF